MQVANIEKREFYTLLQACSYLNAKHTTNIFNQNNLLNKFYEYKLPVYFYLDDFEVLLNCEIEIINDFNNEWSDDRKAKLFKIIIELLEKISFDRGLLYQLYNTNIQKILALGFVDITGEPATKIYGEVTTNAFCGFAIPNHINKPYNTIEYLNSTLKSDGLDCDFTLSDIEIYPYQTSHNDDLLNFHIREIKENFPNIIDVEPVTSWQNEKDDDFLLDLIPILKIGFDDLTIVHSDLEKLETLIFADALNTQNPPANNDMELPTRTANNAGKIISALAVELLKMDITQPYGKSNKDIAHAIERQGDTLSEDTIAHWLKIAHQVSQ